jgi:biotin operon repressor
LIGDPDLGLELGETLRARLQASLAKADRLSGEELADKLGLRW